MLYVRSQLWLPFGIVSATPVSRGRRPFASRSPTRCKATDPARPAISAIGLSLVLESRGKIEAALDVAPIASRRKAILHRLGSRRIAEATARRMGLYRDYGDHPGLRRLGHLEATPPYELLAEVLNRSHAMGELPLLASILARSDAGRPALWATLIRRVERPSTLSTHRLLPARRVPRQATRDPTRDARRAPRRSPSRSHCRW